MRPIVTLALLLLALSIAACTATPIVIPGGADAGPHTGADSAGTAPRQDAGVTPSPDSAHTSDAGASDSAVTPRVDIPAATVDGLAPPDTIGGDAAKGDGGRTGDGGKRDGTAVAKDGTVTTVDGGALPVEAGVIPSP